MLSVDPQSVQASALLKSTLPSEWSAIRLKFLLAAPITDGPHLTPEFTFEGFPFLSVDGIQNGELVFEACRYVSEEDHREFSKKAAPERDDILLGKAASTGKIARVKVDTEFSIWSPLALIRADTRKVLSAFLEYCLKSTLLQSQIDDLCSSNTQKNISMGDIPRLTLPLPSLEVQHSIANYLDRETARIDALITEKERMLVLLEEKRAALISRVITRGLDPNAPLKPSGSPWFDEIPYNWSVERLKWTIKSVASGVSVNASDQPMEGYGFGVLKTSAVSGGRFLPCENKSVWDTEYDRLACPVIQNTIIMSRMNTPALVGESGYVESDYPNLFLPDRLWQISFNEERVHVPFMALLLSSKEARHAVSSMATGTSPSMKNLAIEEMTSLLVPIPPIQEQRMIHEEIKRRNTIIFPLQQELAKSLRILKERRAALITAAVTGQIPVEEMRV